MSESPTSGRTLSRKDAILQLCESQSHQLVSGLTTAREFIATVVDGLVGEVDPQQLTHLTAATDCIDDCRDALETIVTITQLESQRVQVELQSVDVAELIKAVVADGPSLATEKRLRFAYEYDLDLPLARADRGLLVEVLNKLVLNAIHLSPANGQITVSVATRTDGDHPRMIQIALTTDGAQSAGYLAGAFDLFQCAMQNDASSGPPLGLVACKELIELHGGQIWAETRDDCRTSYVCTVPCAVADETQLVRASQEASQ